MCYGFRGVTKMMNTSGSEKTCTPILSYFVSLSRLANGCQITTQQGKLADTGERLESEDLVVQVLFSVFVSQIDSCNEKWEAIKKKRSEAGKKGMESRWGKSKQTITNDNNVIGVITSDNKPKQTITKITVTDTVTGTVTVPVTNKPPDGTAPDGAAPPAEPAQK